MERILITGGTGLVGTVLIKKLHKLGYEVNILSRSKKEDVAGIKYFQWDVKEKYIEEKAFTGVKHIVHLAGASVAEEKWTEKYKDILYTSRIRSAELLYNNIPRESKIEIETFISSSGINYYGTKTTEKIFTEEDGPGEDYLAQLTVHWENAADLFKRKVKRVVKLRTPLVMSKEGGALPTLSKPIKMGFGAPLGSGRQYTPWVHIDDLVNAYVFAIQNDITGNYNVVALEQLTNKELTKKIAQYLGKTLWAPKVPAFILRFILGKERADIVLEGSRASGEKLQKAGFEYKHPILDFDDLL